MQPERHKDHNDIQNWIKLLPEMEGNLFLYMGKHERVLHHQVREETEEVVIKTDHRTRTISFAKLQSVLADFLPVDEHKPVVVETGIQTNVYKELTAMLMDNMRKVKEDPAFIEQAASMNETAKQVVSIGRLQIEAYRAAEKYAKNEDGGF